MSYLDAHVSIASSDLPLIDFSVELNNNMEEGYRIRSTTPELLAYSVPAKFTAHGSLHTDFTDQTRLADMIASTARTIAVIMDTKTLTFAGAKFDKFPVTINPERLIPVKIEWKGIDVVVT
jgi:hypothetical protein